MKVVPVHPTKVYVGVEVKLHKIELSSFRIRPLYPLRKLLRLLLNKRLDRPQSSSGRVGEIAVAQNLNIQSSSIKCSR